MATFDVDAITRELQAEFALFCYSREECETKVNSATPEHVARLLVALAVVTQQVELHRESLSDFVPDVGVVQWDADFAAWKERLGNYRAQVAKAPPGDRQDILWSTTAPLLLGLFGGENSNLPQQPIDAITPFSLANQLQVADDWRDERLERFYGDLRDEAKKVVAAAGGFGLIAAAVVLGLFIARRR